MELNGNLIGQAYIYSCAPNIAAHLTPCSIVVAMYIIRCDGINLFRHRKCSIKNQLFDQNELKATKRSDDCDEIRMTRVGVLELDNDYGSE
ncbi:hypothetical protein VNO80_02371 [Phaseolus coccineus]|uniref:Uncharacterized protein n=1 Tax=Phaseolus coccineus TaxID=3886 RepID=A0AAN9NPV2_PHACN